MGARIREKNLLSCEQNRFECICAKYDRDDILCCHVLRLLTQLGIHKIPDAYIKERWTTSYLEDAVKKQKMIRTNSEGNQSGNKQTYMH